jgi:prolyl-tRNA editing enzyme YbaK/EbsC (Cys-tRNA(Pro) deacylase)
MGLVCQINDNDNPLDIVIPSQWHFDNKKYRKRFKRKAFFFFFALNHF